LSDVEPEDRLLAFDFDAACLVIGFDNERLAYEKAKADR
jgi:hypothetical protein